jgi:transcriptional regulator with XRE-family HTH domain
MDNITTHAQRAIIGRHLHQLRDQRKLTRYAAAKLATISQDQLKSIELADRSYTFDSLLKLTAVYDIDLPNLIISS